MGNVFRRIRIPRPRKNRSFRRIGIALLMTGTLMLSCGKGKKKEPVVINSPDTAVEIVEKPKIEDPGPKKYEEPDVGKNEGKCAMTISMRLAMKGKNVAFNPNSITDEDILSIRNDPGLNLDEVCPSPQETVRMFREGQEVLRK